MKPSKHNIADLMKLGSEIGYRKLEGYEKIRQRIYNQNDKLCSKLHKIIEFGKSPKHKCISCDNIVGWDNCNYCHRIGREYKPYTREQRNGHIGCIKCNLYNKEKHQKNYTMAIFGLHDIQRVNEKLLAGQQRVKYVDIDIAYQKYLEFIDLQKQILASDYYYKDKAE